jgi:hypothetical protein
MVHMWADFWDWIAYLIEDTEPATSPRRNGSIILCDDSGGEIKRWNFTEAFPLRVRGPNLNSRSERELAVEELVLSVDTIQIQEETEAESESAEGSGEEGGGEGAGETQSAAGGGGGEASESQSEGEVTQSP